MSISAILGNALSGLNVSQAALRATSNNISNVNTPGYARSQPQIISRNVAGAGLGVDARDLQRITDRFLLAASLSANGDAAAGEVRSGILDRVQSQFGAPGDAGSVFERLGTAFSEIGSAALDPASGARRNTAIGDVQALFDEFARLDGELNNARTEAQRQTGIAIDKANALLTQINTLNGDISRGRIQGDATGAENRQEALLTELSSILDIKVERNQNDAAVVRTGDGVLLLGEFQIILEKTAQDQPIQGRTPSGNVIDLQTHIKNGSLRGYLDLADTELPALTQELSELATGAADTLNAAHAEASAVPPPALLKGRNTGLTGTDALNFTGQTTLALVDANGALARRISIDFDAGTLSVDGGAATAIGSSVSSLSSALNTALGALGSASFSNGALTLAATGSNGLALAQDTAAPSARAGQSFSHFFGLNDLVTSANPVTFATGLAGADAHGLAAGGALNFTVTGPDDRTRAQISVPVTGASLNDYLTALNDPASGLGRFATFSLDANGRLVQSPVAGAESYTVSLSNDTTARGTTGLSFSQIFGLGDAVRGTRASAFAVRADIAASPDKLALAQLDVSSASAVGDTVLGRGDGRGGVAIAAALQQARQFQNAGALSGANGSLSDFAGRFISDVGARANRALRQSDAATALSQEASQRLANVQGVNIDEELARMTQFQQSYNASARLIQAAKELTDTLLSLI